MIAFYNTQIHTRNTHNLLIYIFKHKYKHVLKVVVSVVEGAYCVIHALDSMSAEISVKYLYLFIIINNINNGPR